MLFLDLQDDFYKIARGGHTKPLRLIVGKDGVTFEKKRRRHRKSKAKKHAAMIEKVKAAFEKLNAAQEAKESGRPSATPAPSHAEKKKEEDIMEEMEEEYEDSGDAPIHPGAGFSRNDLEAWREEARMLSVEEIMERMRL